MVQNVVLSRLWLRVQKRLQNCFSGETCCEECGRRFTSLKALSAHKRKYHSSEEHICKVCQKVFSCRVNLVRHQNTHENICYPCENCPKTFSRLPTLNEHTRKCINASAHVQTCNECGKKLSSKKALKRHGKLHQAPKTCTILGHFKCHFCPGNFFRILA